MSVKIRTVRPGSWEVDIHVVLPRRNASAGAETDLGVVQVCRASVGTRSRAPVALDWIATVEERGGCQRLKSLCRDSSTVMPERTATSRAAWRRRRPSFGFISYRSLGTTKLDAITSEDVQMLKSHLSRKAPKTVNNILTTLNRLLTIAVEWGVIESLPCTIKHLRVPPALMAFHDFEEYERLTKAALDIDMNTYVIVLLGGEAGLRCGEMMALAGADVDLQRGCVMVERSEWKGHVTVPKGGRGRRLPLTARLSDALRRYRHLRGGRVLCEGGGRSFTQKMVRGAGAFGRAARWITAQGCPRTSAYVLLALGHARRSCEGDSGAGGT